MQFSTVNSFSYTTRKAKGNPNVGSEEGGDNVKKQNQAESVSKSQTHHLLNEECTMYSHSFICMCFGFLLERQSSFRVVLFVEFSMNFEPHTGKILS